MTTGTLTKGAVLQYNTWGAREYVTPPTFYNEYVGESYYGTYQTKTWSGGDAGALTPRKYGPKRYYTTISQGKVVTKYFREKPIKRARFRVPQAYTMTSKKWFCARGSGQSKHLYANGYWNYRYDAPSLGFIMGNPVNSPCPVPAPPAFTANDQIRLVGKLRERMRGSDFNLAVFAGESRQTLEMIASSAFKLATAYKLSRKGDLVAAARVLTSGRTLPPPRNAVKHSKQADRDRASNWLELQYGWLPLLSDMKAGAELLAHQLHVPFRQRYSERIRRELTPAEVSPNAAYGWTNGYSIRTRQIVAYISESESVATLSGLMDPELVAWELTPFSFVADWVIPIGSYLEARAFANRLQGQFVTTDLVRQRAAGYYPKTDSPTGYYNIPGAGFYYEVVSMTRSVSTTLAVPMPTVKGLDKIASWQHAANAVALLVQSVRK